MCFHYQFLSHAIVRSLRISKGNGLTTPGCSSPPLSPQRSWSYFNHLQIRWEHFKMDPQEFRLEISAIQRPCKVTRIRRQYAHLSFFFSLTTTDSRQVDAATAGGRKYPERIANTYLLFLQHRFPSNLNKCSQTKKSCQNHVKESGTWIFYEAALLLARRRFLFFFPRRLLKITTNIFFLNLTMI